MSDLLPCPFCGKKPNPTWTDESYIECTNRKCSVYGYVLSTGNWNNRPIEDALNARITELSQAVGLITTLKPTMVMDANHPLDMVREVAEHVTARITNLEAANRGLCEQYSHELNENIALQSRIAELEAAQRWIPVSERLPDTKILYDKFDVIVELVDIANGEMIRHVDLLSYDYRNKSWNDDCGEFGFCPVTGITHWRERPTPPEVQE